MYGFNQLLGFMKKNDASDLYLTVGRPPCFKVNGAVRPAGKELLNPESLRQLIESFLTEEQSREFQETKELNVAVCYDDLGRFRVNCYMQMANPAVVVRKIETDIKSIKELNVPSVLEEVAMVKRGLVLVVGATGSGKSTTLAAMIDHRNRNEAGHIVTIEDPVEFVHQHQKCVISQREVGVDTDSFRTALKNTLRQAPTVILIGEIRDEETMEHALTFAETGHLCLATLHSNNANQAMERVINFFPPERHRQIYLQLSLNLKGIISQRLVKTNDGGRAAAVEILLSSSRIRELIKRGEVDSIKEAMIDGNLDGMQTFDQALLELYRAGRITQEEALQNADSVTDMKLKMKLEESGEISATEDGEESPAAFHFEEDEEEETLEEEAPTLSL